MRIRERGSKGLGAWIAGAAARLWIFAKHSGGGTAVIFGLSLPLLVLAVGGGMDLTSAMAHRQTISNALEVACAQSSIEINHKIFKGADAFTDFGPEVVTPMARARLTEAGLSGVSIRSRTAFNNTQIFAESQSPAYFAQIGGLESFPIRVSRECRYNQGVQTRPPGQTLFVESFEQAHSVGNNDWTVLGVNGAAASGATWNGWSTINAGIEINGIPALSGGSIRFGNFFGELDSHCYVSGCNSNSGMTRTLNLQPGNYQIGYWYVSRIRNSDPSWSLVVACAPKDTDPAVAPYRAWQGETNRIEAHVQRRGQNALNSDTLIDVCVYSGSWTQRRIAFQVTTAGEYRFTWRAAGQRDTVGGLIDYLQLCKDACS